MTATMTITGLTVHFEGSRAPAADGVDLTLTPGRILALVGESGSGKSVTAMGSMGLLGASARVSGSVRVAGRELVGAPRRVLDEVRGQHVGMIFQDPGAALDPLRTISSTLQEAMAVHDSVPRRQRRHRVLELLTMVGLDQAERIAASYPHQLSGGQLQRVCIGLAMASGPRVLLADEPTTALDVTVQAGILDLLRRVARDQEVAVLLITHDMAVVADVADEVAVMRSGHIVERGEVGRIFSDPRHPYTRSLLAAVPRLDLLRDAEGVDARPGGADEPARSDADGSPAEPLVTVQDLNVVHRNRRRSVHAVRGVSFEIRRGEVLGLVGESGSGKSTIASALIGVVPASSGSINVAGTQVVGAGRAELNGVRRRTGFVQQNPTSALNPRRTVGWSISEPLLLAGGMTSARRRARIDELLDAVHLPRSFATRYPHQMSGGQRQRVAIARALALHPGLVIADEPTSALDVSVQAVVLELLADLQAELGFACLFVSHDLAVVEQMASRIVVLSQGRIVEQGSAAQVLGSPRHAYTRGLVDAVPVPDPQVQAERRRRLAASRAA